MDATAVVPWAITSGQNKKPAPTRPPFADPVSYTHLKAVAYHKLVEGVDAQKYGKQWIVTRNAMEREYGPAPQR